MICRQIIFWDDQQTTKSFRVTLNFNYSEDKMHIRHKGLLKNDQEIVEEVEQQAVADY